MSMKMMNPRDPKQQTTSEKNTSDDWRQIMDVCDRVKESASGPNECLKAITKRLNNDNPKVVLQAVTLLDACVNYCGRKFLLEVAGTEFEQHFYKILNNPRTHSKVSLRLRENLKKWAEGKFKGDLQLSLIPALYLKLKEEGFDFDAQTDSPEKTMKYRLHSNRPNPNLVHVEEEDIVTAIRLSLQELGSNSFESGSQAWRDVRAETLSIDAAESDFDTEQFISEVESRRALWDSSARDYSDGDLKRKDWEELVPIFLKKEASTAEKNEFAKQLQLKWKSLRDSYTRERVRLACIPAGSLVSVQSPYAFYNQLSFLERVGEGEDTSSNMAKEAAAEARPSDGDEPLTSYAGTSVEEEEEEERGKREKVDRISPEADRPVNGLLSVLQSQTLAREREEEESDRLFLLSLLNPLKKIPEHLRFGVRTEIMQVIHNATLNNAFSHNFNPYQPHQ